MNITLLRLALSLLFLLVPAYAFWRLDKRLLQQSAQVLLRATLSLAILAVCLYYVFLWNSPWLNLLWVLLSGAVATAVYCHRRWLAIPVFVSTTAASLLVGPLVLLLAGADKLLDARMFIPVMAVLQADALFVARRGLGAFAQNRREHNSLSEYLQGNGATPMQALLPFVARAVVRSFVPVLSQLLLAGIVFIPSLLVGLLIAGIPPLQATGFLAILTLGALCSTVLADVLTIYLYIQLKK